ncbi:MAG: hypothetical protein GX899_03480 [Rikenellaceae bacterium]|jgi:hypothetical protein|nr:hypothetical protein [Rikenellaceae bacterium]
MWCHCFDPGKDINNIHKRVREDATILSLMELVGASSDTVASQIIKRSRWDDLAGNEKRICIYFKPSMPSRNSIITGELLQVDCHVPAKDDYVAYKIQGRIKQILHGHEVGSRKYYFYGQLGELLTMDGFFCVGNRFVFYATI